jgi:hypothetical protein
LQCEEVVIRQGVQFSITPCRALSAGRLLILFFLYPFVDFFPVYRDIFGRIDADPDLIAFDAQYRDGNVIAYDQGLTNAPR